VALLVVEDRDHHVIRNRVALVGGLDDLVVVVDRAGLRGDHALDDVYDVALVLGWLQVGLLGLEVHRPGHHAVELLDTRRELSGVAKLLLDVSAK
jgi:hypothetical protein